ncbi:MAG TPA: hypothetical protein VGN13_09175 [Solirubrobacteraceae bacterium]|jgi:hypothetical protein
MGKFASLTLSRIRIHSLASFAALLALSTSLLVASSATAAVSSAPVARTGAASNVTFDSALLSGSIDPRGQATNFVFEYGPTRTYGTATPLAAAGGGTAAVKVTQAIAGLQPNTVYHYRLLAFGGSATTRGEDRTFQTPKIPLSLALAGAPNPDLFGSPFFVDGNLSGTNGGGRQVVLKINPFPYLGGFKVLGNPQVTSATGAFSFPVVGLLENAQLQVTTVKQPIVSSAIVLENVAVRVAFHAVHARRRGFFRLYGTVAPAEAGALVGFQLLQPGHRSVNEGGTVVRAATSTVSSFSRVMRVPHHGLYRALVKISDGAHVSNYSAPFLIR